ncbi:hypothetical protein D7294_17240 [Streptomyces hoynatensis]|uniref:Uncharacterized protein n=1 Tax=Streptomyces hoynatensis TaxID=1141874 RepID=A0A3A9Z0C7_9ACTN|nr:hypothetical protein D7294_17240 [Streptomyces hoynatensis]
MDDPLPGRRRRAAASAARRGTGVRRYEDGARLSPLGHADLNCLGRYSFHATVPAGGGLRSLRARDVDVSDGDDERLS